MKSVYLRIKKAMMAIHDGDKGFEELNNIIEERCGSWQQPKCRAKVSISFPQKC